MLPRLRVKELVFLPPHFNSDLVAIPKDAADERKPCHFRRYCATRGRDEDDRFTLSEETQHRG